jgi:hypothetical protein
MIDDAAAARRCGKLPQSPHSMAATCAPHQTHPVIVVQADRAPSRFACARQTAAAATHALRRRLLGQKIEQPFLFTRCPPWKENGAYALC